MAVQCLALEKVNGIPARLEVWMYVPFLIDLVVWLLFAFHLLTVLRVC